MDDVVTLLVGTGEGLVELGAEGAVARVHLKGRDVQAIAGDPTGWWALVEGAEVWHADQDRDQWRRVAAAPDSTRLTCLLADLDGLLVGTAGAHLLRLNDHGELAPVEGFRQLEGRSDWYTPWGGPPDTRWLSAGADGARLANVHVGGIVASSDGGRSWRQTSLDIHADVHQVLVVPDDPSRVLAACAQGLAVSDDHGATWRIDDEGLHATYARAVAVAGDTTVLSVSTGPDGHQSALYRRASARTAPFERCRDGLSEWLAGNVDTGCLVAAGDTVAAADPEGAVFLSDDRALTWARVSAELGPTRCLALVV